MRIGIDVHPLSRNKFTGTERYLLELIKELKKIELSPESRVILYAREKLEILGDLPENWEWRILPWSLPGWTHLRLSFELLFNAPEILFIPVHEIPLFAPKSKVVTTVHDLAFLALPEIYSKWQNLRQRFALWRVRKRADEIICISKQTANDLIENGVDEEKIKIIHLGIDIDNFVNEDRDADEESEEYALFVGRLEFKKGIDFLVKVWREFVKRNEKNRRLVLVGKPGFGYEKILEEIDKVNLGDSLEIVGYVSDKELVDLYRRAKVFVFPTRYEGFGLPVLEAMSLSVPVLASDLLVMREIIDDAGLLAEFDNVEDWVNKLDDIFSDEEMRQLLIEKGRLRVKEFDWSKTARKTARLLEW